ncbi:MAG: ribonuclease HI [Gammaproteobacteria bacterium]|nr:ribonuclease HI [Gammaproteobacteria bacterium]
MKRVVIHTDGACRGNPGPGGWGALLAWNDHRRELSGGEAHTTNNRMELTAAIRALDALRESCQITLFTDSNYLRQGVTQWLAQWQARGWRTADRKPVKNQDLWKQLADAAARHQIEWRWVKGHAGNPENEMADRLANIGLERHALRAVGSGDDFHGESADRIP